MKVDVRGDGIAAYCCVHLLRQAGIETRLMRSERPRVPALLLSPPALHLLREIFARPDLLAGRAPIRKRVVQWDCTQPVFEMEHLGVVTSEQELLSGLLPDDDAALTDEGNPDWLVHCASPLPEGVTHNRLGSRMATAWKVELQGEDASYTCVMESLAAGWLFLLPADARNGWLLSVGDDVGLSHSRVVATRVARLAEASPQFPAHPRIANRLTGQNWLACGSAAMAFDPICGDGTALALRAAILASAVIRAVAKGGDRAALLEHYEARVHAGFGRHVELCRDYYRRGFGGAWWDRELAALDGGLAYNSTAQPFRYRLLGFDLAPLD